MRLLFGSRVWRDRSCRPWRIAAHRRALDDRGRGAGGRGERGGGRGVAVATADQERRRGRGTVRARRPALCGERLGPHGARAEEIRLRGGARRLELRGLAVRGRGRRKSPPRVFRISSSEERLTRKRLSQGGGEGVSRRRARKYRSESWASPRSLSLARVARVVFSVHTAANVLIAGADGFAEADLDGDERGDRGRDRRERRRQTGSRA